MKIIQIYIPLIRKKWYDNDEDLTLLEKFLTIINEKDSKKLNSLVKWGVPYGNDVKNR